MINLEVLINNLKSIVVHFNLHSIANFVIANCYMVFKHVVALLQPNFVGSCPRVR